jgi:dTDP-4-amino-4,6-dideoxygalactose transaminase
LARYDALVARRAENAARLTAGLADLDDLIVPVQVRGRRHVWHQYTIRVRTSSGLSRDEFLARLTHRGVGAGVYYPRLITDYDVYRDHPAVQAGETPRAAQAAAEVVSLPVHQHLTEDQLDDIIAAVREAVAR